MKYKYFLFFSFILFFSCKKEGTNEFDAPTGDTLSFSIFHYNPFLTPGYVTRLHAQGSAPYKWSTGDTTSFIIINKPGDYWCISDSTVILGHVKVIEKSSVINFSTAFSPNNDGLNDNFYIENLELFPHYELKIFDSKKNITFESNENQNFRFFWDGSYQNKTPLPAGKYYYFFNTNIKNKNAKIFRGTVSIIRHY